MLRLSYRNCSLPAAIILINCQQFCYNHLIQTVWNEIIKGFNRRAAKLIFEYKNRTNCKAYSAPPYPLAGQEGGTHPSVPLPFLLRNLHIGRYTLQVLPTPLVSTCETLQLGVCNENSHMWRSKWLHGTLRVMNRLC